MRIAVSYVLVVSFLKTRVFAPSTLTSSTTRGESTLSLSNKTSSGDDDDDDKYGVFENDVVVNVTHCCQVQLIITYHRTQQTLTVNIVKIIGINTLTNRNSYNAIGTTFGRTCGTTPNTTVTTISGTTRPSFTAVVAAAVAKNANDSTRTTDYFNSCADAQLYVGVTVLPDRDKCLVTTAKTTDNIVVWNESFNFGGYREDQLTSRSLQLQLFQSEQLSRNDPIGFAVVPLCHVDLANTQTLVRSLSPGSFQANKLGELLLSLCYQPTIGRMTIVIVKARQLANTDRKQLIDPYVKIWLLNSGKKVEKRKTSVKEKTTNPVYNETIIFSLPTDRVRLASLTFCVADRRTIGHNPVIGQVTLGTRSSPAEVRHWNEVMEKARQPIAQWHRLKNIQ